MDFLSNEQIVKAARVKLDQAGWDYLVGASESETTMRRNRLGFDRLGFRPRILTDVSRVDVSTRFLGQDLRVPIILAPIGIMQTFKPEGATIPAQAAAEFGTIQAVSTNTEPALEEVAAASDAPKIFQLNVRGDLEWTKAIIDRAKSAGYMALCVTADMAVPSRRERPLANPSTTPVMRIGGRTNERPNYMAMLTWDTLDRIKELWGDQPLMLKGVATGEDARLAVEHGVDVVWVSNHGGRQLDHGLGTIEVLPEVVEAVAGRAEVVLDGGIQRGTDVVKALALGAKAVAVGKLQCWGMAADGKDGVRRALEILESEVMTAMALLGVSSLSQLNAKYVCPAESVTPPHEMSAWINIAKERIL